VSRQILDLMAVIQNAGTDVVYRMLNTFQNEKNVSIIQSEIDSSLGEFQELKKWANQSIEHIYYENSKNVQKRFDMIESFAITRRQVVIS
jgi:predicted glycosyl hydrolase (DUF1957 family)